MLLKRIALVFVLLLIPSIVQAQGSLLKRGESGIGFLGGGAINTEGHAVQVALIVTAFGLVDLGGTVGSQLGKGKTSATSTSSLLGELYFLRQEQSKNIPFTVSAFTQYSGVSNRHFLYLGMSLYIRTSESKRKFAQPYLSFAYTKEIDRERSGSTAAAIGISIGKNIGRSSVLSFTPGLSIAQQELTGTLTLGLTFPVPSRERASEPEFDF